MRDAEIKLIRYEGLKSGWLDSRGETQLGYLKIYL
jgi:hypothetical protein